jgi:hypothetical protein
MPIQDDFLEDHTDCACMQNVDKAHNTEIEEITIVE